MGGIVGLKDTLYGWGWLRAPVERSALSIEEYLSMVGQFSYNGHTYPYGAVVNPPGQQAVEEIAATFAGYVQAAYQRNGVVAACMLARESLFSEARFQWRRFREGRPGQLFGNEELGLLEVPWPNGTTGDLLVRMEQDATLAGNFYARRRRDRLDRMRPDWVSIVLASDTDPDHPSWALDAEVIGYTYQPGGASGSADPVTLQREEVIHYAPRKDPVKRFLGISLLSSALNEIQADRAATSEKQRYFEGGGPRIVATLPIQDPVKFQAAAQRLRSEAGLEGDARWLIQQPGGTYENLGSTLEEMDFKKIQGAGETRIAAALGVPPVIVGLSEGLEAATYSNYALAMRRFADLTMRPLWRNAAASLQTVLDVPAGAELWYDDRDIPALKDDIVNRADVWTKNAAAARQLVDGGFEPDSVIDAIGADDWSLLKHTGLPTVQVQEPTGNGASSNGQPPETEEENEGTLAERARVILEGVRT